MLSFSTYSTALKKERQEVSLYPKTMPELENAKIISSESINVRQYLSHTSGSASDRIICSTISRHHLFEDIGRCSHLWNCKSLGKTWFSTKNLGLLYVSLLCHAMVPLPEAFFNSSSMSLTALLWVPQCLNPFKMFIFTVIVTLGKSQKSQVPDQWTRTHLRVI